ncbi:Patched-related protein [Dirofilaria immitis]
MKQLEGFNKRFEDLFIKGFYYHGLLVGRYPERFLIGSILLTIICTMGLPYVQINLDLYKLFVPLDAPVRREFERLTDFTEMPFGISERNRDKRQVNIFNDPVRIDVIRFYAIHEENSNLLKSHILRRIYRYTTEIMNTTVKFNGKIYRFEDFCQKSSKEEKCSNELNIWLKHAEVLFQDGKTNSNPNLQLSYPVMYLFNRPKDIGQVIYGVNVTGRKREISSAKVVTVHWHIYFDSSPEKEKAYLAFRRELDKFWLSKRNESKIKFIAHNDKAMNDEMLMIIETALPFAGIASLQLMLFVIISNYSRDITRSKPIEGYLAVISVMLSLICTFGLLFRLGVLFNPVSCTMPFLILAVGVDDAFLMLGAWRTTDRRLSVEKRMAMTMSDAGLSITVTSVTDFGCFALGYFLCPIPAVSDFCLLTACGILMDYFFQITFYASFMVYGGRREAKGGLISYCCKSRSDKNISANNYMQQPYIHRWFRDTYAPFILRKDVRLISLVVFIIYTILAAYGCMTITVDISPRKYIRDDSPIQPFIHLADKYIWADNVMPVFHVMNPPDFRLAQSRVRMNELIYRLEHTTYSVGRVSTIFWLWEYQRFLNDFPNINYTKSFYEKKYLIDFFDQSDSQQYKAYVKLKRNVTDGEPCIAAFAFQTSFYGLDSWDKRHNELHRWRAMIAEYPDFDIFLAGIFSPFLIDQRKSIAPSSMQSIGSAISVMAMLSVLFLPDKQSVFFMTWSLLSISMGVCGGLSLCGSDLDSVSMGCIVMAIGLAVDFSIHICYRYHRSSQQTANEKVRESLMVVGWPVVQAGASTLFSMIVLPLIPAYLIRVFFQTVLLVNFIGLTHALLWLPQLISSLDPCERIPLRFRYPLKEYKPQF